ncbi:TPA: rod shape-determining protein RodA [Legionella pneumophila subsp. pneumophila]|uniref:Peptidoglycan glycosyltransferase MrdB n=1 Tax=Legionella pneumophila (strain Lens) TaxID=297245 RepID=Q5WWX4_LEGPL|nr:rod shape-determining protein RodA [Legionella pneumophila]AOW52080.1 rod shape-determining protein RodA [Legionella pneumophila subsp. pneumophila]AOW54329.1 rod shape-determining protein RodA [Legionella pneumophila subsp. pneumophila]AOW57376.1 rod shape-determining protein RodA [Legionella pneumophila subsp. pneumophila]AOW59698.1 rod shape-determining protein RodA [Legionella pneumophila subsp. pneumophila]AOW62875.1 rod shape-determining protein RodA [Legionella pneumophila subsp. pne
MSRQTTKPVYRFTAKSLHLDFPLLGLILTLITFGLLILYSASNANMGMIMRQSMRLLFAFLIMFVLGFIPPHKYKIWTPWIYGVGLSLLIAVMLMGKIGKGAQRWLELGLFRFQPSEIMKLAVPMMAAWFFDRQSHPSSLRSIGIASLIIFIPALLIAKQPDLGTAIMVTVAGLCVVFLAGIRFKIILLIALLMCSAIPVVWNLMHDYQKQRVYTLIDPEQDPLGAGYHIIQSKIAIGSGGLMGKGWLKGSQSHLNFLPEHATDFIFAVSGEEFGFAGGFAIVALIVLISLRSLNIANNAQTTYTRLLSASLAMTFFLSAFVNIGMVMGIIPVVGIPLPLVSYGGTAMVTFLASFGILMSISSHRILFNSLN